MNHTQLIERLRKADVGDSDLSFAVTQIVDPDAVRFSSAHLHYSESIDAALSLVERRNLSKRDALGFALQRDVDRLALSLCEYVLTEADRG